MKKALLFTALVLGGVQAQAQTKMDKMIDSVSDWSRLSGYENKLYLTTKTVGGAQYEVNTTTGATTAIANFATPGTNESYTAITDDLLVMNGKMTKVLKNGSTNVSYLLAGDNATVDTLITLPGTEYFTDIKKIGAKVVVTTDRYVMVTDLTKANTAIIDSFRMTGAWLAGTTYQLFIKQKGSNGNDRYIMRTDGITTVKIDSVSGGNYYIDLIGEADGDFYYSITLNSASPTITLKKTNSTSLSTVVNTFNPGGMPVNVLVGSPVTAIGLGKIYMMIKSSAAPFYNDLYVYDISTAGALTKLTTATNTLTFRAVMNKAMFSKSLFYFTTTGSVTDLWKTDGTVAGTSLYHAKADIRFYDPGYNHFNLALTGVFCDDYPIAGINTDPGTPADVEYHYGTATGFKKFNINASGSASPKDFVKMGNDVFFLANEKTSNKLSLYKVDGCGEPVVGIANTMKVENEVNVYPNPGNGMLTVTAANLPAATQITLYNLQGQQQSITIHHNGNMVSVNATMLPKGVYILHVATANTRHQQKVVIL